MNDATLDQLPPLKVKCTQSDCKNGLHCYLATQKMRRQNDEGRCRSCGIELVDCGECKDAGLAKRGHT